MTHQEWIKEINIKYESDAYVWEIFWSAYWNYPTSPKADFAYNFLMGMALSK